MVNWSHWHTEPLLIGGILVTGWIYSLLIGPLRGLLTGSQNFPKKEAIYFTMGLATFYLAVGSPLDALSKGFLSAHMLQHNALMYISSLFIVLGIPDWLIDTPARKSKTFRTIFRIMVNPLVAGFLFTFTFSIWHFPNFLEAALHSRAIQGLEHITLFLSSILMWWCIASRSKRFPPLQYGVQIIYLFLLMVAQTPVFGFLTLAKEALYPTYADAAPIISHLAPIGDQMLGGFIMKLTNILASLVFMGRAFYIWSKESEKTVTPKRHQTLNRDHLK